MLLAVAQISLWGVGYHYRQINPPIRVADQHYQSSYGLTGFNCDIDRNTLSEFNLAAR